MLILVDYCWNYFLQSSFRICLYFQYPPTSHSFKCSLFFIYFFIYYKKWHCFLFSFLSFHHFFSTLIKIKSMNHESCIFALVSINKDTNMVRHDFDNPIYHADKDCELPEELARLLRQESKSSNHTRNRRSYQPWDRRGCKRSQNRHRFRK